MPKAWKCLALVRRGPWRLDALRGVGPAQEYAADELRLGQLQVALGLYRDPSQNLITLKPSWMN
ncbi:MAG: hypothetical protein C0483_10225 [Pirellula sp.]|nr:hypothetical protein [Pirellula sp.]